MTLFESLTSPVVLYQSAQLALRKCKRSPERALFLCNLSQELFQLRQQLLAGVYEFGPYQQKIVIDPKKRLIHKAPFRDRVVHQAITFVLEPRMERHLIFDTHACRKGKGTDLALNRAQAACKSHKYALKMDVSKYFKSINQHLLLCKLKRIVPDRRLMELSQNLVMSFEEGIPIGNLTLQIFANWFLNDLDQFIKRTLKVKSYFRYMDDLLIFGQTKAQLWGFAHAIANFGAQEELLFPKSKTYVFPTAKGVPFLGYHLFANRKPRMHQRKLRRLRAGLKQALKMQHPSLARLKFLAGWMGSAGRGLCPKLRADLGI